MMADVHSLIMIRPGSGIFVSDNASVDDYCGFEEVQTKQRDNKLDDVI